MSGRSVSGSGSGIPGSKIGKGMVKGQKRGDPGGLPFDLDKSEGRRLFLWLGLLIGLRGRLILGLGIPGGFRGFHRRLVR